jgi:hypothetical protein
MASLFNLIKTGSSSLAQQSQEETQQLAKKTGQIVNPTTPATAATLGANKDQQKMAGSSANLQAVARQGAAQAGARSERTQQRTATGQRGMTPEEIRKQELATKLGGLSFLGAGVQNSFNQALDSAQASGLTPSTLTPENTYVSSHPELSKLPAAQKETAKGLISKVGSGDASPEDLVQLGSLMGIQDQSKLGELTDSIRQKMFNPQEQQTGNLTAQQVQDRIQFSDIDRTSMEANGLSIDSLSQELGVAPGDLLKFTPSELSARVAFVTQQRFDRTESLKNILTNPLATPETRKAALDGLRELGVTGISRFEKVQQMTEGQLDQDDFVVSPNGETMHLEDALSDDSLTQLAMDALEDPNKMAALQASNPGLATAIQRNAQLIEQKYAQMNEDVKGFEKLQQENRSSLTESGFSSDTMKNLGIDASKLQSKTYQEQLVSKPGAAAIFEQKDPAVSAAFNKVFEASPDIGNLVATATKEDLTASGLNSPAGMAAYAEYAEQNDILESMTEDVPPAVVLSSVGLSKDALDSIIADSQAAAAFSGQPIPLELAAYQKDPSTKNALALAKSILTPKSQLINPKDLIGFGGATKENLTVDGRMTKLQTDANGTATVAFQDQFKSYLKDGEFSATDMQDAADKDFGGLDALVESDTVPQSLRDTARAQLTLKAKQDLPSKINQFKSNNQSNYALAWKNALEAQGNEYGFNKEGAALQSLMGIIETDLLSSNGLLQQELGPKAKYLSAEDKRNAVLELSAPFREPAIARFEGELGAALSRVNTAQFGGKNYGFGKRLLRGAADGLKAYYSRLGMTEKVVEIDTKLNQLAEKEQRREAIQEKSEARKEANRQKKERAGK